ncbi:MAG: hypothetical protein JNK29_13085 [Anaerolineales bacterium]|nr:hypothetical protein [Anaerolineales bacterium]
MPMVERDREIRKRRNRNAKVQALKARLVVERDTKVRARLLGRLKKIAPNAQVPEK